MKRIHGLWCYRQLFNSGARLEAAEARRLMDTPPPPRHNGDDLPHFFDKAAQQDKGHAQQEPERAMR